MTDVATTTDVTNMATTTNVTDMVTTTNVTYMAMTGRGCGMIRITRFRANNMIVPICHQARGDTRTMPPLLHVTFVGNFIRERRVIGYWCLLYMWTGAFDVLVGHMAKDCKKGSTSNEGYGNNKQHATRGRVFSLTTDPASAPDTEKSENKGRVSTEMELKLEHTQQGSSDDVSEGLSAGITHDAEGRQLADVVAYNPSAKADYLSALQHLQNVNFSLIVELKSNKDASVDTIMSLLRLDDRVVGASALSLSLEVSHFRVKKMRENIAKHVSDLRGVFVPLSAAALEGMKGTFGSTHDATTTLSTTFVSTSTIPPISTDDYEVAHANAQGGAGVDDETAAIDDINLYDTRRRMCPHIQEAQNGSHTTIVTGTHNTATKVLALRKQKLLPRNIVTKESILEERKQCQKVKEVQEGTGSQNERSKSQAWRMTYPNHGVWFDNLPKESIDSYDDLRKAFLENYLQLKKCIKDPVEIHNIKQRNGESTKEFMRRYKLECRDGEMATSNREWKKSFPSWKQEAEQKQNFKRGNFQNEQRMERKQDRFTLLTKTLREILALNKGKFKPPMPMTTLVKKGMPTSFVSFIVRKDQAKIAKKGETSGKDKPLAILMVQPWKKISRQRITQTFFLEPVISFPTLGEEDGIEGPMIIKAEMGGHCVHHIYVDGGSSSEILNEHCFSTFRPEIKNQLIPANTPLVGFSGEIIWPLGQISLLVRIGDEEHSTSAWMNLMVVRSPSPYNGIIGRPGQDHFAKCSMVSEPGVLRPSINQVKEEKFQVAIHSEHPEQTVAIGSTLTEEGQKELCGLLRRHLDMFAWKLADMTGGYRQIKMAEEDEEKTAFITSQGIFCYSKMQFGLKNARATYQRLVDKAFQKQIGRNLDVYEDDLVIKSRTEKEVIRDAEEMFKTLRKINMKLNPKKCAFGMRECTFLGYKVDVDGLRVSPDKVKAVLYLPSPKCLNDVQKLNGKLASLNRFLSKPTKKSLPFFKTLKKCTKKSDFQWIPKAEGTFKEMKQSIAELPMLTTPKEKEELIIYLAAAKEAIIAVLITERDVKQVTIYFVSQALQGP
nr:reverse transcriptase domain-containing protein [Tanacetum cinerariifolium]